MKHPENAILDLLDCHPVVYDLLSMILGDVIGSGVGRRVHAVQPGFGAYEDCVIKLEIGQGYQNIQEWQVWGEIKDKELGKWFAPCVTISQCGTALIQRRTYPIEDHELPAKVPALFTDFKGDNWGRYNGGVVCHDYGMHFAYNHLRAQLKKADWQ